jgi:hypothetical protein
VVSGLTREQRDAIRMRWIITPSLHAGTGFSGTEEVDRRDTLVLLDALEAAEARAESHVHDDCWDLVMSDIAPGYTPKCNCWRAVLGGDRS